MDSPLLDIQEEIKNAAPRPVLDAKAQEQYQRIIYRILRARNHREQTRDEFDGLTFEQDYLLNKRAAQSYLVPKKNDDEVRINTGITEKRIEYVLNELLAMNLEEEIEAYDTDDNKLVTLGDCLTDMVKRTEQMEKADDKDLWIYQELLTQRAVFVQELWSERNIRLPGSKKSFKKVARPERRLWQGLQVYLGDIFMPDYRFQEQPYIARYARMTYEEGKTVFGDLPRFKSVTPGVYTQINPLSSMLYRKNAMLMYEIECWEYIDAPNREYQLIINGVPMYDPGEDLPWEWDGYDMEMVSLKPTTNDWAYGKPLTASAKTLQALDNETIRNLIRKFRQALEPPMGMSGGKTFTRDIWVPGTVVQGIKKDDFSKLIDHQGVTSSELEMFKLIETKIDEFIGTQQPNLGAKVTATQYMMVQKQAAKMLGLAVLAAMRLHSKLGMLRAKNNVSNYSKPIGKKINPLTKKLEDVYASFTLDDVNLANGKTGSRIIQLGTKSLTSQEMEQLFKEQQQSAKKGKNIEVKVLNVEKLANLDLYFHCNVISKPKDSTDLEKSMFDDKLKQAGEVTAVTGLRPNPTKVVDSWERIWKEKDFFEREAPQPQQMQPGMPGPGGQPMPIPNQQSINKPSLNTLSGNLPA